MQKFNLKKHKFSGKLIVFEGVDATGKTTLINSTIKNLEQKNIKCCYVKMPSKFIKNYDIFDAYDNSKDDHIRNLINLEHLTVLVCGDRLVQLDALIIPALKHGDVVVCDRYAYTGYARSPTSLIKKISNCFLEPDVKIMTYCDIDEIINRITKRPNEKNNYINKEEIEKQLKNFKKVGKLNNFYFLNTNNPQKETEKQLFKFIDSKLKK